MESSSIMQLSGWPSLFHLIAADFFITKLVSWGVARLWKPCPFEQTRCIQILLTTSNFVPDLRPLNQFTTIRSSLATDWDEADIGGVVPRVVRHFRTSLIAPHPPPCHNLSCPLDRGPHYANHPRCTVGHQPPISVDPHGSS